MTVDFHPEADAEFVEAVAYYEDCEPGLGIDLSREVFATIQNVVDYPTMWPEIEDEVHRCLVHRFPYGVLYSIEPDGIFILAVMHLHRDPEYWKHRLGTGRTSH
jgi:plasmid stabilization system protein ParE